MSTDYVGDPGLSTVSTDTTTGQSYIPMLASSPALDGGDNAACSTYDQLGNPRIVDGNGDGVALCDIGAYELQPTQTADVCPSGCAYSDIQAAIDAAATGATIKVGPGTYSGSIGVKSSVTLVSTTGAKNTIITGTTKTITTETGATLGYVAWVSSGAVLDGFTVTGGGIGVGVSRLAVVRNNIIKENTSSNYAGILGGPTGYYYTSYQATIEGNTIESNTSTDGSIVTIPASGDIFNRNIVRNNTSSMPTIAVSGYNTNQTISNNLIVGNTVTTPGSAIIEFPSYNYPKLINNTITGNNGWGIKGYDHSYATLVNSIVWGNSSGDVIGSGTSSIAIGNSILGTVTGIVATGNGNILADPLFIGGGNYHVSPTSPAIDTGKDTSAYGGTQDLDNIVRPQDGDGLGAGSTGDGSDYDIGAYEYH